jgi:RNA polymerase sigma factor (sigma-70 family)
MARVQAVEVISDYAKEPEGKRSDKSLLEQFLSGAENASDDAFRALVKRHGPMVLGLCRRVLDQEADAEDAFQATFLILARKAASIRNRAILAAWLHEVAYRMAVKVRDRTVRRRYAERQSVSICPSRFVLDRQHQDAVWNELLPVLHDEVHRLPEKYRIPVILSYLEGKTNEEVAALLEWPVGTVKGRLSRARDLLRSRLTRRGMALLAAFLVTAMCEGVVLAEVVLAELVARTLRFVQRFGPRAAAPDRASASTQEPTESRLPTRVESPAHTNRKPSKLARHPFLTLISLLSVSALVGIGLAIYLSGKSSSLRSAPSAIVPVRATGASCH